MAISLTKTQMDRVARAVKRVEAAGVDLRANKVLPVVPSETLLAKITDADGSGGYSWRRQVYSGAGEIGDDAEGIEGEFSAHEINFLVPDTDSVVLLTFAGYDADDEDIPVYTFSIGWRKQGFNVYVTMDGGSAGTDTTPCTFTYTVKDAWGNTLATAVPLSRPRPAAGAYVAAPNGSRATAYRTSLDAADLVLWDVAEVEDTEAC